MKKFIYFIILFLVLFSMLSWSLDALEVIDAKSAVLNLSSRIPVLNNYLVRRSELLELKNDNKRLEQLIISKDDKIDALNNEIEALEEELNEQENIVAEVKGDYSKLAQNKKNREARLEKVADIYRSMDAESAAAVIMKMEQELALEVLSRLKEEKAAAILESLSQDKAAHLFNLLSS